MNQITCDIARDLLPLYIDRVCSADSAALVEAHLQSCPTCKAEYEKLSQREFRYDAREKELLAGLSKRWKKSKRSILWRALAVALAVMLAGSALVYGAGEKAVPASGIEVSALSRLENGDLAFILTAADGSGLREVYLNAVDSSGTVCITAVTTRLPLFSTSQSAESGWIFNTKDTGIKRICYTEGYLNDSTEFTIWEEQDAVAAADEQTLARIKRMETLEDRGSDALTQEIYRKKATYIGSAPDDMKLLGAMHIGDILGPYTIQLTTASEPYGITLHFKNPVAPAECEAFDAKMRAYATVILAMIDNSGWVGWTYPSYNRAGEEIQAETTFDLEGAQAFAGSAVKRFGESEASLRELCDRLALY